MSPARKRPRRQPVTRTTAFRVAYLFVAVAGWLGVGDASAEVWTGPFAILLGCALVGMFFPSLTCVLAVGAGAGLYTFVQGVMYGATESWGGPNNVVVGAALIASIALFLACFVAVASILLRPLGPPFKPGHCIECEYPLIGLPEPRCPECGTPFDPSEVRAIASHNLSSAYA